MSLIESLLSLPEHGEPIATSPEINAALAQASAKFVCLQGSVWRLTQSGRRFLAQFRAYHADTASRVVVRLVMEGDQPLFHLICNEATILKVTTADLQRRLGEIRAGNPGVKITFEYSRSDSAP